MHGKNDETLPQEDGGKSQAQLRSAHYTVVIEVEAVINSRPLTYVSSDDFEQPLTPAHLLSGRRLFSLPDGIYCKDIEEDFETTPQLLTKRLITLKLLSLNVYWPCDWLCWYG